MKKLDVANKENARILNTRDLIWENFIIFIKKLTFLCNINKKNSN